MDKTVLVIEDEIAILRLLDEVLHDEGYSVLTASDGNMALECLRDHTPDVVVLDYMLPYMDGAAFAQKARRHHLLTAGPSEQWARAVGAAACMQKPFDLNSVVQWVERLATHPSYYQKSAAESPVCEKAAS